MEDNQEAINKIKESAEVLRTALVHKFRNPVNPGTSDYITSACYRMTLSDFIEKVVPAELQSGFGSVIDAPADTANTKLKALLKQLPNGSYISNVTHFDHMDVNGRNITGDDFLYFDIKPKISQSRSNSQSGQGRGGRS